MLPASFGKIFSYSVDGSIYAQPLYLPNVFIPGKGIHNVIYVATMKDSVYAFDADSNSGANAAPLWQVNFTNPAAGITAVPVDSTVQPYDQNIEGTIGILSTPVIDQSTNTMYLVARTKENGQYVQRMHALDVMTGAEKLGGPITIQATIAGTAYDSVNGQMTFNPLRENQRSGLALANGIVYMAWGSHDDYDPYHGWVMAYNASNLQQIGAFSTTPDGARGGVWQSGQPPAIDTNGNLFFSSGNGDWNGVRNFGTSVFKLSTAVTSVIDWFTPDDYDYLNNNDLDLGVSGVLLLPNSNLMLTGSKTGDVYLLRQDNLGHMQTGNSQIPQIVHAAAGHIHGSPVYWNSPSLGPLIYLWGETDYLKAFRFNGATLAASPIMTSMVAAAPGMPGGILSVSANGTTPGSGIVWASLPLTGDAEDAIVPGILRAFDAGDLTKELWNSTLNLSRDDVGNFGKFSPPTIANGKVYMASFSNRLNVYGFLNANSDFVLQTTPTAFAATLSSSVNFSVNVTYV
ncbi:MAG: hypothetical protein DMG16_20325, partial [Acidobacteria bacterium]